MKNMKVSMSLVLLAEVTHILHLPWSSVQIQPLRARRQNTNLTIGLIGVSEVRFTGNLEFH